MSSKIEFKELPYQTAAVDAVLECFAGQPYQSPFNYRVDPGVVKVEPKNEEVQSSLAIEVENTNELDMDIGFRNPPIALTEAELLANIQAVQKRQNLFLSKHLQHYTNHEGKNVPASYKPGAELNIDVEMETGTGKTYCYIKTIFEMSKRFGWNKFIIIVPSIAIREGVYKSLELTAEHFAEQYHKKARFFIYNSSRLHELESFSSDAGINIMVMNIQAFNSRGRDNRRIYDELDDFQSRRPIDVIKANRPILILDEPQKMEGKATLEALPEFDPLFIMRYSATHKTIHNLVHRLDAVDAYNQKLVKKISVRGIQTHGLSGTSAYLYLQNIEISKQAPVARLELQVQSASGTISRRVRRIAKGDDLFHLSGGLDAYKDRFVVSEIDARTDTVEFTNGITIQAGDVLGDVTEEQLRRIQIRETINAHLENEKRLYAQGIKVLSLFFIDEVAKYRDYTRADEKGDYARIFEEEYLDACRVYLDEELALDGDEAYRKYLHGIAVEHTHQGYFSIDRQKKLVNPKFPVRTGISDDVDAYDLIMRDKERLLSFKEPTRFIFSHSALREGWDNPNVFVLCMLKQTDSDNTISRRQEVGRGLRIAVNKNGKRVDDPELVHDVNVLTVVANESYSAFVDGLQKEMLEELAARPRKANVDYFKGKVLILADDAEPHEVTVQEARVLYHYLVRNDYVDVEDELTDKYHKDAENNALQPMPAEITAIEEPLKLLVRSVFTNESLPHIEDGRGLKDNPRNDENYHKKEFQELWQRINQKGVYRVDYDTSELVGLAVGALDKSLKVTPLKYTVEMGTQKETFTGEDLGRKDIFEVEGSRQEKETKAVITNVRYDLLGKISENTELKRETVAEILSRIKPTTFHMFQQNPEQFISEASRLIQEQKATTIINHITYDLVNERHDGSELFTAVQKGQNFSEATQRLKKHVYDYIVTDSKVERDFVEKLDVSNEVAVYAKLPKGFFIPTPVGNYNPDWAIAFNDGTVKHVYFVAETKGSMSTMELRQIENSKIECARRFFTELAAKQNDFAVKYDVVTNYDELMSLVS